MIFFCVGSFLGQVMSSTLFTFDGSVATVIPLLYRYGLTFEPSLEKKSVAANCF
jgi:hypothetical protein